MVTLCLQHGFHLPLCVGEGLIDGLQSRAEGGERLFFVHPGKDMIAHAFVRFVRHKPADSATRAILVFVQDRAVVAYLAGLDGARIGDQGAGQGILMRGEAVAPVGPAGDGVIAALPGFAEERRQLRTRPVPGDGLDDVVALGIGHGRLHGGEVDVPGNQPFRADPSPQGDGVGAESVNGLEQPDGLIGVRRVAEGAGVVVRGQLGMDEGVSTGVGGHGKALPHVRQPLREGLVAIDVPGAAGELPVGPHLLQAAGPVVQAVHGADDALERQFEDLPALFRGEAGGEVYSEPG